jgi:FAD synthetase
MTSLYPPIRSVYITAPYPFAALDTFVDISVQRYNLNLVRFGGGMKIALERFLDGDVGKGVKAVLVGTRRGDPHGGESLFMVESMW